jgi:hypothetical protein
VKSGRRRQVPLVPWIPGLLERLIGVREAGFVLFSETLLSGEAQSALSFASLRSFQAHLQKLVIDLGAAIQKPCRSIRRVRTVEVVKEGGWLYRKLGEGPDKGGAVVQLP